MKALSIRQPWPWLMIRPDVTDRASFSISDIKDVENRNWQTYLREEFLLHASKTHDCEGEEWVRWNFPHIPLPHRDSLPRGGVVGHALLADCVTEDISPWFFGPYGFQIRGATHMDFIPCRGLPGFFNLDITP